MAIDSVQHVVSCGFVSYKHNHHNKNSNIPILSPFWITPHLLNGMRQFLHASSSELNAKGGRRIDLTIGTVQHVVSHRRTRTRNTNTNTNKTTTSPHSLCYPLGPTTTITTTTSSSSWYHHHHHHDYTILIVVIVVPSSPSPLLLILQY